MRALDARDVLRLWDACAALHPIDRTLAMLRASSPDEAIDAIAALPIGERERRAAALRVITFGADAEAANSCPACGLAHEVVPPLREILDAPPAPTEPFAITVRDHELLVRVPDSRDQAAITHCADAADAHRTIVGRCIVAATCLGEEVPVDALPAAIVAEVAEALAERDANAETLITLTCVECATRWTTVFDVGEFVWAELGHRARRLLHEVSALARAYHWSEAEILSMSAQRREAYLDLVGG